jgi:hypothetical protein
VNRLAPQLRRLTLALMRLATQLLARTRADWARAMHAELDRIGDQQEAFAWAMASLHSVSEPTMPSIFGVEFCFSRYCRHWAPYTCCGYSREIRTGVLRFQTDDSVSLARTTSASAT